MTDRIHWPAALCLVFTAPLAATQTARTKSPPGHHEVPVDAPGLPAAANQRGVTAGAVVTRGRFTSVQVNVSAFGGNIVGDAANEPSIAVDPLDPNRIAIGWRQFDTIQSNFRQAGYAFSQDGGQTWTFPGVLEPGRFRSDPVLDADADGNFYYYSLSSATSVQLFKSIDGGVTWTGPVPGLGGDKQWMAIDRTSGVGSGNIYVVWNIQFTCCSGADFARSIDGGESFEQPIGLPLPSMKWGTLDVGPDGELYLAGATLNTSGHLVTRSLDAKNKANPPTFDFIQNVDLGGTTTAGLGFAGPNPAGLHGQVWVKTDHSDGPSRGNVYILGSVNPPGPDPMDVMFIRSTDGGMNWTAPVRVNDDPIGNGAFQWFGTISVAPNGRIDVFWNDTRNTGVANLSELHYAFSTDAGDTWSINEPASPIFNSHLNFPQQNKIGDYYHAVSNNDGVDLAYSATFNGEQDVYHLRVGIDCNGNGVDDATDIADETSGDCNNNAVPDDCEPDVDCNLNGTQDICDIAAGIGEDCNGNLALDQCEPDEDCNINGTQDICDIASGFSRDCNGNGTPDSCDIDSGQLEDLDGNGIPDICDCPPSTPAESAACCPDQGSGTTLRYLSFHAGDAGATQAIRITFADLPGPHSVLNGHSMWATRPETVSELGGQLLPGPGSSRFAAATLDCVPLFTTWSTIDTLHVSHQAIVPGGVYRIQVVSGACEDFDESAFSSALVVATSQWGDTVGAFVDGAWTPPDGTINVPSDVIAVLDKFGSRVGAPVKARCDVEPAIPDRLINITDVTRTLDAFSGIAFPFAPAEPCAKR